MNTRRKATVKSGSINLPEFSAHNLLIRTKQGEISPLIFNDVQNRLHKRLEGLLKRTGRVRALILKARQPGVSTYVQSRYYHKLLQRSGVQAYILTHQRDATEVIFEIAERFHKNNPDPQKPKTAVANAKEICFADTGSGYRVGTAGNKAVGRGQTFQLFHGSEVAHWPNAGSHMAGLMQAVPDADETEIILESTANGPAGLFYDLCQAAHRGEGEFELIFIPWFDHKEYSAVPPRGWRPPPAILDYGKLHKLKRRQLYWAWRKNDNLIRACGGAPGEICWLFRQEYPATTEEAFRGSAQDGLIRADLVLAARKFVAGDQSHAPLILVIDIARGGADKTHIINRQGRVAGAIINRSVDSSDLMEVAGIVGAEIERLNPDMCFIDGTGIGAGVYDRLRERGFRCVTLVNFGSRPEDTRKYANKRAEMWGLLSEWLADPMGVDIPDEDSLHAQLCAPGYSFDSSSRLVLEAKEKIRDRLGSSPDAGDSLALTFAETVRRDVNWCAIQPSTNSDYRIFEF